MHAGDEARRRRLPGAGVLRARLRVRAPRPGPVERRRHPEPGRHRRRRRRLRRRRVEADEARLLVGHVRRRARRRACTCPTAARSTTSTTSTSSTGSTGCARTSSRRATRDDAGGGLRRLQHRPRGPRRVGPAKRSSARPTSASPSGTPLARARGVGPRRRVPPLHPDDDRLYSWWDYRAGDFHKHRGMRIDLMLATQAAGRARRVGARRPQRPQGQAAVRPRAVIVDFARRALRRMSRRGRAPRPSARAWSHARARVPRCAALARRACASVIERFVATTAPLEVFHGVGRRARGDRAPRSARTRRSISSSGSPRRPTPATRRVRSTTAR